MTVLSLISWNMNQQASNWEAVLTAGVDAALLQEAKPPPSYLREKIAVDVEGDWLATGLPWRAVVAGLSDRIVVSPIMTQPLGGGNPDALMVSRPGTIAAAVVRVLATGEEVIIVSLYSVWANTIQRAGRWLYADASAHRLISDLSALIGSNKPGVSQGDGSCGFLICRSNINAGSGLGGRRGAGHGRLLRIKAPR